MTNVKGRTKNLERRSIIAVLYNNRANGVSVATSVAKQNYIFIILKF